MNINVSIMCCFPQYKSRTFVETVENYTVFKAGICGTPGICGVSSTVDELVPQNVEEEPGGQTLG